MTKQASRTACVVGFHRSGTSLTARVLNVLGVYLGEESDLLGPQEADNPRGYWEPTWMNDLNEEILEALGTKWWLPLGTAPGWEQAPELAKLRERAALLMEEKLGDAPLRGWKDPRSTLTLPIWKPASGDARYILCVRNPIDAIASLQRRPEPTLPIRQWGELWLEYMARGILETNGAPRMVVFYEDYFKDGPAQVRRLAEFLEIPLEEDSLRTAEALVESGLRHHTTAPAELAATGIPAASRALYLGLRAAHQDEHAPRDNADGEMSAALRRVAPDLWWDSVQAKRAMEQATRADEQRQKAERDWQQAHEDNNHIALELDVARRRIEALERQLADLGRQGERDLAAARAEFEHERKLSADLKSSISWRVTAPMRAAKRGVRKAVARRR